MPDANSVNYFFFSSRRRHTRCGRDWSSDVCSSDLFHGACALQLQRRTLFRHDLRAVRHRMPGIERIRMLVGREKFLHLTSVRQLDVARDVRDEESVLTDHLRQEHATILSDPKAQQMIVEGF